MPNIRRTYLSQILLYMLLLAGVIATVLPFLYMISTSLKGTVYAFEIPPRLIPYHPTLKNFIAAWTSNRFDRYFINSLSVTVVTTALVVGLGSMMAFASSFRKLVIKPS